MAEEREPTAAEVAANVARTEAETLERAANAKFYDAQTLRAEAETEKFRQEALEAAQKLKTAEFFTQQAAFGTEQVRISTEELIRKEKDLKAHDLLNHVYNFHGAVTAASVKSCIDQLSLWTRQEPGCDIEIVFHSPGGGVFDGMHLWDHIQWVRDRGHHVTTTAMGYAASMGGILLQAGDKRVMGRESYVLIHEVSSGAGGTTAAIEDEVEFMKKVQKRIIKIFVDRSVLTARQIETKWKRKDWWLDSDECQRLGLVDEVR